MEKKSKFTKILCTIGPASSDKNIIERMYKNGMNGVRINTAHGDFGDYRKIVDNVRSLINVPIVLDIKGPELRIRLSRKLFVEKNMQFKIYAYPNDEQPYFSFDILKDISEGDTILIDDGKYICKIIKKEKEFIIVRGKEDMELIPNKSLNIPARSLSLPPLSDKDIESICFAKKNNIEYIALSFVRNKRDLINLQEKLENTNIKIIAKIENKEGVRNIDEILENCAGVMVARGDLGVELSLEKIPQAQKEIIRKCNNMGKINIVATQMLESMIKSSKPTRAEVSDITNAILDGADALMLSQETAIEIFR